MAFDVFCLEVGVELRPQQVKVFADAGLLRAWDFVRPDKTLTEIILMLGKGSGKDLIASLVVAYVAYIILNMKGDPATFFDLMPGSTLYIVNVAPTERQARTIFFQYLKHHLASPLFTPFLRAGGQILADEIRFPQKNLLLLSMHSRSASLEGYNILLWVMDEADDFVTTETGGSNADRIHKIFRSSSSTRLQNRSLGIVISYPRTEDGFMMGLEKWFLEEWALYGAACGLYFKRASTWEMRPEIDKETNSIILADYRNDPSLAAAMYECRPMPTEGAFFEFPEKIEDAIEKGRTPCASVVEDTVIITLQNGEERKYVSGIVESVTRIPGCTYFLTGDGGLKGDSYALAVFHIDETSNAMAFLCERCAILHPQMLQFAAYGQHREQIPAKVGTKCGICQREPDAFEGMYGWWEKRGTDRQTELILNGRAFSIPHVYEDLLLEFQPKRRTPDNPEPILVHYPGVQEVCRELITRLSVVRARFDPWMTAETLQGLQKNTGIDVGEISFSQPDQYRRARLAKAMLYANLITLLPDQPKRDKEWRRLQRNGRKIDHPKGAGESKDLYDAEAAAIWLSATYNFGVMELEWLSGL